VRQLDAGLAKSLGRLEEEVPLLYKRLRYPVTISRSNLTAVGSPHTWPAILAALTWLAELLAYGERAEAARAAAGDARARAEADFFSYVAAGYRHFLAGDDGAVEAVDAEKAGEFEARAGGARGEAEALAAGVAELKAQLAELAARPSALAAARSRREETLADRAKFVALLDSLAAHKAGLERKVAERGADVAAAQAALAEAGAEAGALRARVAAQTVHPADVARMRASRAEAEAALRAVAAAREAAAARADAGAAALDARLDALEGALAGYHARADRLALLPASAKRAEGVAFEARLERGAPRSGDFALAGADLRGIARPALQRLRERYAGRARELASEELGLRERADAARAAAAERADECAAAEAAARELESRYRAGKAGLEAEVAAALHAVEGLAAEVDGLRGAAASGVAESEERLRALQAEGEELARACELENATLHRDLAAALEAVLNHKVALGARLRATAERVGRALEAARGAPLPRAGA
jgi:kinetochore protein NDC80